MILKAYWHDPNINLMYEFYWNGFKICAGDQIKVRRQRGKFRFTRIVADIKAQKEWAECLDMETGKYRKFYMDQIAGPVFKRSMKV